MNDLDNLVEWWPDRSFEWKHKDYPHCRSHLPFDELLQTSQGVHHTTVQPFWLGSTWYGLYRENKEYGHGMDSIWASGIGIGDLDDVDDGARCLWDMCCSNAVKHWQQTIAWVCWRWSNHVFHYAHPIIWKKVLGECSEALVKGLGKVYRETFGWIRIEMKALFEWSHVWCAWQRRGWWEEKIG